jgi:hypothetical protein
MSFEAMKGNQMLSIEGTFSGGVARPDDVVAGRDGQRVLITFVDEANAEELAVIDDGWDTLNALINKCQMSTGISDLAHQHDHYVHGTPKRTEQ